ncbi:MAG: 30S ribosomal protein S2 [Microgenomates group bacterium GW2011_GWA2_40_6]|nr:MAG: 30S ribosomal protein S2 [Microgenomates group bacterium GW2011_GWA2_40_6]
MVKVKEKKVEVKVKTEKKYDLSVGLKDLLAAGSHLGHKISKTNPKAKEFIYVAKEGIQIIDLVKTLAKLDDCYR